MKVKDYLNEFDFGKGPRKLKQAIEKGLIVKRYKHIAFSDIPLCDKMNLIAISYNDTHILTEWNRGTKLIPRKRV